MKGGVLDVYDDPIGGSGSSGSDSQSHSNPPAPSNTHSDLEEKMQS